MMAETIDAQQGAVFCLRIQASRSNGTGTISAEAERHGSLKLELRVVAAEDGQRNLGPRVLCGGVAVC